MSEPGTKTLSELFSLSLSGEWGSEPIEYGNATVLRAADFTKDCKLRLEVGAARQIPKIKLESKAIVNGDILIEKSGGSPDQPVGRVVFFDRENTERHHIHSNFLQLLRPSNDVDAKFVYYVMCQLYAAGLVLRYQQQTTGIINLKLEHYLQEKVLIPSALIQFKIRDILDTVNQAIEKTEALIEKYQKIKTGLMHDLFTRGIGADGKLRPPREEAPELYQRTVIGWIPKDWKTIKLESLLANVSNSLRSGPFGSALLKSELVENGVPFLGIDNIYPERFEDSFKRFVSESKFLHLSKYAVRANDVVITIMGTVGRAALIPSHVTKALSSKHLWTMTFDPELVQPELVSWQLNSSAWVESWFRRCSQGGIMDAIQSRTLRELQLPVPKKIEQKRILERYIAMNSTLAAESDFLEKLKKQKHGLMQDLLAGKVQVKVPPTEQATA